MPSSRRFMSGCGWGIIALVLLTCAPSWAFVGTIGLTPEAPTADDEITVNVSGDLPDPCWSITETDVQRGNGSLHVEILMARRPAVCPAVIVPYTQNVLIGKLAPGSYRLTVKDAQTSESMAFEVTGDPVLPGHAHFVRGNANNDQKVDIADAVTVITYLFEGATTPTCLEALDTNNDGNGDLSDAIYLLNYLFLGGPSPREPFPACGPDEDEDTLGCEETICA